MAEKNLNRIKVMLAEKEKTNKWLAEKLGRDQATISKFVTQSTLMQDFKYVGLDI